MTNEAQLLAWFDREGYDVQLSERAGQWTAAGALKIQPVGAAPYESGTTREDALGRLRDRLIAERGLQP